jgi:hypothetical protein
MPRALPKSAGARSVFRSAQKRARQRGTLKISPIKYKPFSATRRIWTSGNLATNSVRVAGAGGINPSATTMDRMKRMPPRMPARPPQRKTLYSWNRWVRGCKCTIGAAECLPGRPLIGYRALLHRLGALSVSCSDGEGMEPADSKPCWHPI